ncbi:MAG: NAD-dependent epimerase/dehydratase family protein [Bacteroidota bacterium]
MHDKTALIAGATGVVGRELLRLLLEHDYYDRIVVVTRKELNIKDNRIDVLILKDFEQLPQYADRINVDHVYCLIGATLRNAGTKDNFRKINHDFPLLLAQTVKDLPNFEQFVFASSYGANANSPLLFNRIKGETEEAMQRIGLKSLKIFRYSLLMGFKGEWRWGDELSKAMSALLSFFVIGSRRKMLMIQGAEVAKSMFLIAQEGKEGTDKYRPQDMHRLAHA